MRREAHHEMEVFFQQDSLGQPIWKDTYVYATLSEEWKKRLCRIAETLTE